MSAPHGTKRPADGALDGEQRLSKRFDLLNLDNAHKSARLYLPVSSPSSTSTPTTSPTRTRTTTSTPLAPHVPQPQRQHAPPTTTAADAMLVEDTPHRLYIHDLAAELSDLESDDEHPVFLSDIEKHLSKIPRHLLLGPPPNPTEHNQLVLYNVPASLTLPEEHDNVRKAIVEARQRIRDKQLSPVTEPERVMLQADPAAITMPRDHDNDDDDDDDDADAMDLD
ncbi:uncharacterized protein EKO05_0002123 [Ascochyta rabiei]|uniref:uncharacterized protein n=1 Tax=Didymella rabiei TaxID=5454 RepID=UPI00190231EB|nr:uncharacterized protein EKO05_0002123 [Ascochyta rabiei]UPX11519.1 hypothetical protein EKO05_0002123 [Ascochyta rabiei]